LEKLYKSNNYLNIKQREYADEVADIEEFLTNWAVHEVTIKGFATNVLGSANGLI
jgi:hypothetical protein